MPKLSTIPTVYNELKQISISDLKRWDYLNDVCIRNGAIQWSREGVQTSSIGIRVNLTTGSHLELTYKVNDTSINYTVELVRKPSNLGKGFVFYFLCPFSRKLSKKLYLYGKHFVNRTMIQGLYECQRWSSLGRLINANYDYLENASKAMQLLESKHFMKYYDGKPTKRYLKIIHLIEYAKRQPYQSMDALLAS